MTAKKVQVAEDEIAIFNNNPKLKGPGQKLGFTQEQQIEVIKCVRDIVYFATKYCKIVHIDKGLVPFDPYPYQVEMLRHMQNNRFSILKTGRQMGKTTTSAIFLLWYTLFHKRKTIGLLANKGDLAQEILSRYQDMYQELPLWLQQGILSWNKRSIELENKSRIISASTSSSAARGFSFSVLYIDELAFVPHNVWESFYTSVYPTISSGTESRIILTSTPNGLNHFWQMWEKAKEGQSNYAPFGAIWSDVPWRDEAWKKEQIANTSQQQFDQEHEASFLGSSSTLIATSALEGMIIKNPIQIRKDSTRIFKKPIKGHTYIMTADTSRGYKQDYSTFSIVDVTCEPYELVATFRNNEIDPLYFSHFINFYGRTYNNAHVLVEINDAGGQVVDNLFYEHEYENIIQTNRDKKTGNEMMTQKNKGSRRGVYTSKTVKSRGCSVLKSMWEGNALIIHDEDVQSEALHFVRNKAGTSWAAEEGYHDDLMMNLVLFAWLSTQHTFRQILDDVDPFHFAKGQKIAQEYDVVYKEQWTAVDTYDNSRQHFNYDDYHNMFKKW